MRLTAPFHQFVYLFCAVTLCFATLPISAPHTAWAQANAPGEAECAR